MFSLCDEMFGPDLGYDLLEDIEEFDWDARMKHNLVIYVGLGEPVKKVTARYYLL